LNLKVQNLILMAVIVIIDFTPSLAARLR
jgi:hypothetical protein